MHLSENIKDILVCPICKGKIVLEDKFFLCIKCNRRYMQENGKVVNLLPMDLLQDKNFDTWNNRQQMYSCWYKNIWNKRLGIQSKYIYDEYSNYIGTVSGLTLDIGCGSGNFKSYLKEAIYVGIDPLDYKGYNCNFRDELFPFDEKECIFIKAVGELLPFQNQIFDNVFINNTLDHAGRPEEVLSEAYRVLKTKGKLYIVHEDQALLKKVLSKKTKDIFYSLIDKALTLLKSHSIMAPHLAIKKEELMKQLMKNFLVESKSSRSGSHVFICATKQ